MSDSLCAVDAFDELEVAGTECFTFNVHARKNSVSLSSKTAQEASEWISAIQDAIDSCPTIQTITERVILEIIVRGWN